MTLRALRVLAGGARLILQTLLAIIIVFEEWGWRPLAAALAQLARLKPIAWLEAHIQRLPPYGALVVFAMPSILILPLKLIALYLITSGQEVAAAAAVHRRQGRRHGASSRGCSSSPRRSSCGSPGSPGPTASSCRGSMP